MTFSDECALACYEQIAAINENHGVYLVQHKQSKNIFIKKILTVYNTSVFQTLREHHIKGTPEIYEVIEDGEKLIIIEEYISGNTLKSILDNGNLFSEDQALSIIKQLCGILREMHNASPVIIHRDIKPSNIILTSDGDVKLIDMNAAKVHLANKSEDTALIGTVGYAAPLCCVSGQYVRRSLAAAGAGNSNEKFLPASAPAKGQGRRQAPHDTERRSGRRR